MSFQALFFLGAGLFSLVAALADWDWYMNHRKAQFFVRILGRTGARIFYGLLGLFLMVMGLLVSLGLI